MATATLTATQNTTETRKASATLESKRDSSPEMVIARAMNALLRARGGRFALLNDNEITMLTETFFGAIVSQGWRVHKDYPVCTECRQMVRDRAEEARRYAEGEGSDRAGRIRQQWQSDTLDLGE